VITKLARNAAFLWTAANRSGIFTHCVAAIPHLTRMPNRESLMNWNLRDLRKSAVDVPIG
jgi:hypothetical protein